jgi:uncharacterized protein YkwD
MRPDQTERPEEMGQGNGTEPNASMPKEERNQGGTKEEQTEGYAGAVITPRSRKTEENPEQKSYEERQKEYALKQQGKKRVVFTLLPLVAILAVLLVSYKTSKLLANETESVISDESLMAAQTADLTEGNSFDGMDETASQYVRDVVRLVNERRTEKDLPPLALEERLRAAAQVRAGEGAQTELSHTRPDGSSYRTAITRAGVYSGLTGEIMGTGYKTPEAFVEELMKSDSHRAYLLSEDYQYIGVGAAENPEGAKYPGMTFCQLFAR